LDESYVVCLNSAFYDSFNQIESILNAPETIIYNDEITLSLINVVIIDKKIEFNNSLESYIVLEPNWLVNVTALTQFDFCERSLFNNRFSVQDQNEYMLAGNIIHEVFEHLLIGIADPKKSFFNKLNNELKKSIDSKIFDFALLDLDVKKMESSIRQHLNALYLYIKNNKSYYDGKEVITEHYIIDNTLGLKGKIDSVIMNSDKMIAVELKTGRSWGRKAKPGHAFQAQAYSLLLENKYQDKTIVNPLIIYSGDHEFYDMKINSKVSLGMKVDFNYKTKAHVVNLRNRLIAADFLFKLEYEKKNQKKCDKCFQLTMCKTLNHLEPISNSKNKPIYNNETHSYSQKNKSFFKLYNQYLTEEASSIKKEIGNFFSKETQERVKLGKCIEVRGIISNSDKSLLLKCDNQSELRERDRCLVSDLDGPIKGECLEASIIKISEKSIQLRVRKAIKFDPKWIDSINSEAIFERNYPSLVNFLNNDKLKKIKNILIDDYKADENSLVEFNEINSDFALNESQSNAIKLAIGIKDLLLIQGPPGTGKTLTIAKIVQQLRSNGKTVLLSCFTHRAIDELIRKLEMYAPEVEFYRIGRKSSSANCIEKDYLDVENIDFEIKKIKENIDKKSVYIGTTYAWLSGKYNKLIGENSYDVAIMDEASQMIIPNSIGIIGLVKSFILVGDHFQQPPVIQNPRAKDLSKTLFQALFENKNLPDSTKVMLNVQHRMNPVIGDFISKTFYANQLKNNESLKFNKLYEEIEKPSTISKICDPEDIITLVHTENHNHTVVGKSLEEDAEIILDLIEFLIKKGIKPKNIGVIAPYRAQVALIRRKIEKFILREDLGFYSKEMVDTIDRFQGDERDVIIFSMCLSDSIDSNLLKDKRKINVALSRAKKKLIVVGNWDLGNQYSIFNSLFKYVEDTESCKIIRI
tara:strand:+ start:3917 stop:6679 length:2763 start_codon:yes stop_codon:yes gene_type:complete